jgi:indole-3-glycerol phosphate synthase
MVRAGAIGLSVLTQPYLFDGSIDYLAQIRKAVNVPILMKDIIVSRIQIDAGRQVGADCILLIKAIFDHDFAEENLETLMSYAESKGMQVLLEVHSDQEFADVLETKHELIGINNRNLETLEVDINNTRNLLTNHDKNNSLIISESGIKKQEDIKYLRSAGADGFLVGTSIMKANDIAAKVGELYNSL